MKNISLRQTLSLFVFLTCLLVQTGCVSGFIVGTGKRYKQLTRENTHYTRVRRSLGEPAWAESFEPPIPIRETPPYLSSASQSDFSPWIWPGRSDRRDHPAGRMEVYIRKGPFSDPTRGQGAVMASGMTFGLMDLEETRDQTRLLLPSQDFLHDRYFTIDGTTSPSPDTNVQNLI